MVYNYCRDCLGSLWMVSFVEDCLVNTIGLCKVCRKPVKGFRIFTKGFYEKRIDRKLNAYDIYFCAKHASVWINIGQGIVTVREIKSLFKDILNERIRLRNKRATFLDNQKKGGGMSKLLMPEKIDIVGSHYIGTLNVTYAALTNVFGPPNGHSDGYKTDVEWAGKIDGQIFTIHNWKNGKNYMGADGLDVKVINEWNVGGYKKETFLNLKTYIENYEKSIHNA